MIRNVIKGGKERKEELMIKKIAAVFLLLFLCSVSFSNAEQIENKASEDKKIRSVEWLDIGVRFDKSHKKFNTMCCPRERKTILPMIQQEYPDFTDIQGYSHKLKEEDIYMTTLDLNGDGIKDILAIVSTWDCGSAGCPVKVYIGEKNGEYRDVLREGDENEKGWAIGISKDRRGRYHDIVIGKNKPEYWGIKYCDFPTYVYSESKRRYVGEGYASGKWSKYLCPKKQFAF